jgi:predicted glutamine amidotransferase
MCGLVAFITKNSHGLTKDQVDAFDNLLFIDALRGMDSTGVFMVERNGDMELAKEATPSFVYRSTPEYKALMQTAYRSGRALVGHNRAATRGVITDQNAHPFVVDDRITLVHNGTLYGDFKKLTTENVDVDSHAIAHKIHECGDDVEAALQQIDGAYALIWHDFKNNTLNFIRNEQRPLHYVEVKDGWIWASEANMLAWILARYDFEPIGDIALLTPGTLTTFNFANNSWNVDSKKITLTKPRKSYTPALGYVPTQYRSGGDGYEEMEAFGAYPACHIPERQNKPPAPNSRFTGRTISEENEIAHKNGIDLPSTKANSEWGALVTDGNVYKGICIDYLTIKPNSGEYGYWLYAVLEKNKNYIIKVFVDANVNEMDLLDACLNNKEGMFKIVSRQWRTYTDASHGQGYAVLNATEFTLVDEEAPSPY